MKIVVLVFIFLFSTLANAFIGSQYLFNGKGEVTDISSFIGEVENGDVVIVGELHGYFPHHQIQREVINQLLAGGHSLAVGIEHIPYPKQDLLSNYYNKSMDMESFLDAIGWPFDPNMDCFSYTTSGGFLDFNVSMPFDCFAEQLNSSTTNSLALNLPRSITGQVARGGLDSLTKDQEKLLPPNFQVGSDLYYERFVEAITGGGGHGHIDEGFLKRSFVAQSLWDETMAWKTLEHLGKNPEDVVVIMVGDFHAAYSLGLKARLLDRGAQKVHVVSQILMEDPQDLEQVKQVALPSKNYGERGDLITVSTYKEPSKGFLPANNMGLILQLSGPWLINGKLKGF